MTKIKIWNAYSRLETTDNVKIELAVRATSAKGVKLYSVKTYKGPLYTITFPAGLTRRVAKACRVPGADILDLRTKPAWDWFPERASWLRDYQREGIALVAQRTRVLLRAPTGSGKGEVVAGIAAAAPSARILILTPRAALVNDLRDRVERRAGRTVYALGTFPDPDEPCVQIATYSKAAQMASGALGIKPKSKAKPTDGDNDLVVEPGEPTRDWREMTEEERQATIALFNSFDTIICDEAHVVAASSYYRVIRLCNNAYYRIGLSATPTERTDGKNLYIIGAFSDIATLAEFDALIERKDISDYAVEWTKVPPMERPDTIPKSFAAQYHIAIVANEIRNRLILRKAYVAPKPTIVFCERLDHAERLYTQWTEKVTAPAVYVTGEVSKAAREKIIADAKSGKVEVIFATKVFAEGIDIPNLASVVNAGGLKAPIPLLQKIGRAMRVTESKSTFVLYDFEDSQLWLKRNWPKIHTSQRKAELAKHHGK